jgi:N-sulfoglucosamine sulfohydrolase
MTMDAARPNILLITADDMDGRTPGAFGGPAGVTPHLDALAADGMIFRRSHVPIAVCQPSRSAIMTGLWPHRNGAEGFESIHDGVPLLTELLRQRGYLSGILGKVDHIQPVERFGWDLTRGMRELGMGRNPRRYGEATAEFLALAAERGAPWFLMANAHDPHRPFHGSPDELAKWSDEERAGYPDPSAAFGPDLEPPGFLPDLPEVRTEYAEYLASARRCDDVVGAVLAEVERAGVLDDTLVVFLSDNGMAFPFAKANCYLRSTLTPLIVRWPRRVQPGSVDDTSFVSMLDLFPTFCEAAGIPVEIDQDGRSLLPLFATPDPERDEIFTVFHETSAKRRYEMRCRQDAETGYIWNAWSDGETEYKAENMAGRTWPAMLDAADADPALRTRLDDYVLRVPEELYDLTADPDCLVNLVADPAAAERLARSRERTAAWLRSTGDPLAERFATTVGAA